MKWRIAAVVILALGVFVAVAGADIGDNLREKMRGDYFNHVTVTAVTADQWFSRTSTDPSATETNFSVRRLRLDYRQGTAILAITLYSSSAPAGSPKQEVVLVPAGALVDVVGHRINRYQVTAGPTAGNPLYLIAEN